MHFWERGEGQVGARASIVQPQEGYGGPFGGGVSHGGYRGTEQASSASGKALVSGPTV